MGLEDLLKRTPGSIVLERASESDLVALLRERGWMVVHVDDFTIENFHTNSYFRTVVDKVAQWRAHPTDPPTDEELARVVRLLSLPLLATDSPTEEEVR